jgi:hypothetical protein
MPRTNLSLGNLFRAVSGSVRTGAVSLGGLNGGTSNTNIQGFSFDSVTVTPPTFTYIVESTTENASFSFSTSGSFVATKVATQANNFTCSFNNANFTVGSATLGTNPTFPITPAAINLSNYSEAQSTLTMAYADGFNLAATNYGISTTKVLYAVDVYNTINQPDFCLLFGTKVELADGTEINVEDLNVGDQIKAWVPTGLPDEDLDPESNDVDWRMWKKENLDGSNSIVNVQDMVFNFASGYYSINNGLIKATGTHPVFVFDNEIQKYHFKNIEDLLPGDKLIKNSDGSVEEIEVFNIEQIMEDVEIVTLNVENADVYLSNNIVSHNKGTTTQPYIPSAGLRMYLDPTKAQSFPGNALPATGTPTTDWLDLSGYNTGVRPAGVSNAAGITGGNPAYNNGATRKDEYFTGNGTNQFWYKDTTTNINGGISQFNTNTGTIHMWIRPTTTLGVASRHIFDYAGFYGLAVESTDNSALNRIQFRASSLGNSGQFTTSLSSNVWYMISVAFQPSGTCTVYVDKTSIGTYTSSAFTAPSSTNFLTVGSNSARTTFWNGQIGPVLFYNTLQNATAVGQVYDYFSPTYK